MEERRWERHSFAKAFGSAVAVEPNETPLHNPAARMDSKVDLTGRFAEHRNGSASGVSDAIGCLILSTKTRLTNGRLRRDKSILT